MIILEFILMFLVVIVTTVNPHLLLSRKRVGGRAFHNAMVELGLYNECRFIL